MDFLRQQGPAAVIVEVHPLRQHQPNGVIPVNHTTQLHQYILGADGQLYQRDWQAAALQIVEIAAPGNERLSTGLDQFLCHPGNLIGEYSANQNLPVGYLPWEQQLADVVCLFLDR